MKKLLLLCAIALNIGIYAQDTTSFRLIGISTNGDILFFNNDSTVILDYISIDGSSPRGHGIFAHPVSQDLFIIADTAGKTGNRAVYLLSPFDGVIEKLLDTASTYFASADISDDGIIYAITGNAAEYPGTIFALNLEAGTADSIGVSNVTLDEPRALEIIPDSNKIFVVSGFEALIYTYDLTTGEQDTLEILGGMDHEIHGLYFDGNTLLMSDYDFGFYMIDFSEGLTFKYIHDFGRRVMDFCMLDMISTADELYLCSDSVLISSRYAANSYQWYYEGVAIEGATEGNYYAKQTGSYKVLTQIGESDSYVFSEDVTVSVCNITDINNIDEPGKQVRIYPNPANSILNVELFDNTQAVIQIISLNGQIIKNEITGQDSVHTMNISELNHGLYVIQVVSAGKVTRMLFTKN